MVNLDDRIAALESIVEIKLSPEGERILKEAGYELNNDLSNLVKQLIHDVLELVKPERHNQGIVVSNVLFGDEESLDRFYRNGGFNHAIDRMEAKAKELGL
jgi:hypothetical protein